jgi:hypothetical protein
MTSTPVVSCPKEGTLMSFTRKLAGILAAAILIGAAGCSSGISRETARDQATSATCVRFNMCAPFPSAQYASMDACEIDWRANWDKAWPAAQCDGKIDQTAYQMCLEAIASTACNIVDFFATLGKCSAANVCHTANADGG